MTKTHVVFFSGGVASYIAAKRLGGDVICLFTDTATEDPSLYEFLEEAASKLGHPLVWLKDGRDVWDVFEDARYIGNTRVDPCSRILKREPARKWILDNCKPETHDITFGISWDEDHRLNAIRKHWEGWDVLSPLCDPPLMDKKRMIEEAENDGLTIPTLYEKGFPHANCGGFCVKAGQAQFAHLLKEMPERYAYHEKRMNDLMAKQPGLKPFLRKRINGELTYMTMTEWREYVEAGGKYDDRDFGGCNCFFVEDDFIQIKMFGLQ